MKIRLSENFTYKKLIKFTFPTIIMMIFTSIYGVVDGLFISNVVGDGAFAAINLIMPVIMIVGTIGFMFGTGGSAIVSMLLGEKEVQKANRLFSLYIYLEIFLGFIFTIVGLIFLEPIAKVLDATDATLDYCLQYGRILLLGMVPFILQNSFQSFIVVVEKPKFGLIVTLIAGITNMFLDFLFIKILGWQVKGAALATITSQFVGAIIPFIFFCKKNNLLRLGKTHFNFSAIIKACVNGSSEMVTNLSMSLVNILFNMQLMKYIGTNGVSSYGVIMYIGFLFSGTYIGYSVGTAPIIGYHYGAGNEKELKSLLKKSNILLATIALIMTLLAEILARPLASIFVGYNKELLELTIVAIRLYSLSYLISWFNIFASSFFTALNNGFVSAVISFVRTLFFQVIVIIILPLIIGVNGIWLSVVVAEILSTFVSVFSYINNKNKYKYI